MNFYSIYSLLEPNTKYKIYINNECVYHNSKYRFLTSSLYKYLEFCVDSMKAQENKLSFYLSERVIEDNTVLPGIIMSISQSTVDCNITSNHINIIKIRDSHIIIE